MPERQVLAPPGLRDAAPRGYSQGIRVGDTVYVSGQVSRADGLEAQAEQALDGVRQVVEAAAGTMDDVVKLNVFTTETDCWDRIHDVWVRTVSPPWPAVTLVVVRALAAPELLIEIEAVAVIGVGR
jgi:enamine deaminase RidA (YjgF/YER057c/UK114 family)